MVIEDYAHHPTEINATLDAAKNGWHRKIVVVFQPHRYSRLSWLMKNFATSFDKADVLIVTEIYEAGEKAIVGVSGKALYERIQLLGHKNIYFEPELKNIPGLTEKLALPGDMIIIMGAGSIYKVIPDIIKKLEGKS